VLEASQAGASAQVGQLPDGRPGLRRLDLVLFPDAALPVAVEVELSVKAARRLEAICRAWVRCRIGSEVRYYDRRTFSVPFPAPFRRFAAATPSESWSLEALKEVVEVRAGFGAATAGSDRAARSLHQGDFSRGGGRPGTRTNAAPT
jgi:hypothetical protein